SNAKSIKSIVNLVSFAQNHLFTALNHGIGQFHKQFRLYLVPFLTYDLLQCSLGAWIASVHTRLPDADEILGGIQIRGFGRPRKRQRTNVVVMEVFADGAPARIIVMDDIILPVGKDSIDEWMKMLLDDRFHLFPSQCALIEAKRATLSSAEGKE